MFIYAVLDTTGKVVGISDLSSEIDREDHVLYDPSLITVKTGYLYDALSGTFTQPLVADNSPPKISETYLGKKITVNAFRSRFTPQEELAFELALESSPILRLLDKRLQAVLATFVNLDDPIYLEVAIPALVSESILTQERAEHIITSPATWHELPERIQDQFIYGGYLVDV